MIVDVGVQGRFSVECNGEVLEGFNTFTNTFFNTFNGKRLADITANRLAAGSGRVLGDPMQATDLHTRVHTVRAPWGTGKNHVEGNTITVTFTLKATLPKGEAWTLREVGLVRSSTDNRLMTYALLRDANGELTELEFNETDVVTITYYVTLTYLQKYPPQAIDIPDGRGGVAQTVEVQFTHHRPTEVQFPLLMSRSIRASTAPDLTKSFGDPIVLGGEFPEHMVGRIQSIGQPDGYPFCFNITPAIDKTNTQTLSVDVLYRYSNVTTD